MNWYQIIGIVVLSVGVLGFLYPMVQKIRMPNGPKESEKPDRSDYLMSLLNVIETTDNPKVKEHLVNAAQAYFAAMKNNEA